MNERRTQHEPSCVGLAVRIIRVLGSGRIFWVEEEVLNEEPVGHAYVVPDKKRGRKYPLNEPRHRRPGQKRMTIREVIRRGRDRTQEFLDLPEDMT